ncbi:unnamed protein product, partial [Amoebophrya sp. A120]
ETSTPLDRFQKRAIHHMLTNRLAIIQGAPGTGKSFTCRRIIRILHSLQGSCQQLRFLVVTYKNLALDETLSGLLSTFPDNLVRIGNSSSPAETPELSARRLLREAKIDLYSTSEEIIDWKDGRIQDSLRDQTEDQAAAERLGEKEAFLKSLAVQENEEVLDYKERLREETENLYG